jgi:hypothetical protein
MEQATGSAKGQRRKRRRGAKRAKVTITDTTVIKAEGLPKAPASRATRSSWFRT